jgi:hypothetical protein
MIIAISYPKNQRDFFARAQLMLPEGEHASEIKHTLKRGKEIKYKEADKK